MPIQKNKARLNFQFDLLHDLKFMYEVEAIANGEPSHSDADEEDLIDMFNTLGLEIPECLKKFEGFTYIWILSDGSWLPHPPLSHEEPDAQKVKVKNLNSKENKMLELTYQELKLIVLEDDDFSEMTDERFEIIHDDIPPPKLNQKNYKASDYIEDDGRRINLLTFIDHDTKIEYSFIYVFNSNDPVDLEFPYAVIGKLPNNITIVENSQF